MSPNAWQPASTNFWMRGRMNTSRGGRKQTWRIGLWVKWTTLCRVRRPAETSSRPMVSVGSLLWITLKLSQKRYQRRLETISISNPPPSNPHPTNSRVCLEKKTVCQTGPTSLLAPVLIKQYFCFAKFDTGQNPM